MFRFRHVILVAAGLLLSGCATILGDDNDTLISTEPAFVRCSLTDTDFDKVVNTPQVITLPKGSPSVDEVNEMVEQLFPGSADVCSELGQDFAVARRVVTEGEIRAAAEFTDMTAEENPDWQIDINDDVIGVWHADAGRGGHVTLVWGMPLVRGAIAATAELGNEVLDQTPVTDGRFTLVAVDAVSGFGEDLFLAVRLWDESLNELASESLYDDPEGDGEAESADGPADPAEPSSGKSNGSVELEAEDPKTG